MITVVILVAARFGRDLNPGTPAPLSSVAPIPQAAARPPEEAPTSLRHYRNALNLANSAAGALSGGESGTYFSEWFGGIGWLLVGVAALLSGFGGFLYLRKRSKG